MGNAEFVDYLAEREMTPLLIGLTSPSGGGKTLSALRLAVGIQRVVGGEIYHIDTEAGRAKHYAPTPGEPPDLKKLSFGFRHVPFVAPFGPLRYLRAIQHCASKGAGVVIVDSMSHEHEGPGGVLEMHAEDEAKDRSAASKFRSWQRGKGQRRQLINGILQLPTCFIFCFRAKDKIKPAKKKAGDSTEGGMDELGWMPIGGEEFIYEMTISLLFEPQANGFPVLNHATLTNAQKGMFKIPGQFQALFTKPRQLDEAMGEEMGLWSTGGKRLDSEWRAKNTIALQSHATAMEPAKPMVGPDQSEPCAFCKNNPPMCKNCKRPLLFRKSGITQQGTVYGGFWGCPEKCKNPADKRQNTNYNALDWHAILEGDQKPALVSTSELGEY